jgi:hypothetical protein
MDRRRVVSAPFQLPGVGDIVFLERAHIYMGADDLRLRVQEIGDGKNPPHPQAEWVHVSGQALNDDGSNRGYRSALVRLAALYLPTLDG